MAEPELTDFDKRPAIPVGQYDGLIPIIQPGYELMFQIVLALLQTALPQDGAKLLVVGVGTGKELLTFGEANPNWQLLGVDPSNDMLEIARQKLTAPSLAERVSLHQGFVHELPQVAEYDAATCILVHHFLADDGAKQALLDSIAVRLKPGGCFILVDLYADKSSADFELLLTALIKHYQNVNIPAAGIQNFRETTLPKLMKLVPAARLEQLMQQAGFEKSVQFFSAFLTGGWVAFKK